jgi:Fic family protein
MSFEPKFTITPRIASSLMRIEAAKQAVEHLPITPSVLASLRESSRLLATHYSTMMEGNRLTQEQVTQVIAKQEGLRRARVALPDPRRHRPLPVRHHPSLF